jgi:pyruvate dehydrogenase E2 component (dihydrolipoamide acetyltransferase)
MSEIVMPKFGLTMTEGLITAWHRKPGEPVRKGELLFEVETEKVTNEVEATSDGILDEILVDKGSVAPVGMPIARFRDEGAPAPRGADAPSARKLMAEHGIERREVVGSGRDGRVMKTDVLRIIATPLARRLAKERGVALEGLAGSGPGGRIKAADVTAAPTEVTPDLVTATTPAPLADARITVPDAARSATARKVQAAKRDIPHFYLTRHVDVAALSALRAELNARADGRVKLTVTHLLVKAAGLALAAHPDLNRVWLPEGILTLDTVGVGIVTETPQGLRIPVLDRVDDLALDDLAAAASELFGRAREGRLASADVTGGAISISNVGMFGADSLTPIISPPQAMILGVGAEQALFRPDAEGRPSLRREIVLTLAADHRLIDGAVAARLLGAIAEFIENPIALLRSPARRATPSEDRT